MKVLLLSHFHPDLVRGGAQVVCYELFKELNQQNEIEAVFLAGAGGVAPDLYKAEAQIVGFEGRKGEFLFLTRDYDQAWSKVSDDVLIAAFSRFLQDTCPDVVHFHHFMALGVDILSLTRRVLPNARIVFTFHEFRSICEADGQLVRRLDQSICTFASPARCNQCFPERSPGYFAMREMWFKKHLLAVDIFTVPSRFMVDVFTRWGINRDRITVVPNVLRHSNMRQERIDDRPKRNRFGYFGQLSENKGVGLLLQAVDLLRREGYTDFVVEVNGDNLKFASETFRKEVEAFRTKESRRMFDRIVYFNGAYSIEDLRIRMSRIDWSVIPSQWPEAFGLVLSEAWSFGRPVIAANVGGLAERISDGRKGLLFEVGDVQRLAQLIRQASSDKALWTEMVDGIPQLTGDESASETYARLYSGPEASIPHQKVPSGRPSEVERRVSR